MKENQWKISQGSVLDVDFVNELGTFDIVYSWGVLHHTGAMWNGLENLLMCKPKYLYIALYNDQGVISKYWHLVKKIYNFHPALAFITIMIHLPYIYVLRLIVNSIKRRASYRGMDLWIDMKDWLGGLPFEVARPSKVIEFCAQRNMDRHHIKTVGNKLGCNEYVFKKKFHQYDND